MNKLKSDKLLPLFKANEDFSLTETQYQKSTGRTLPKDNNYLKNKSALANLAKEFGFVVEIQEKIIRLKKVI